jgi:lysine 2,3-aminomutase
MPRPSAQTLRGPDALIEAGLAPAEARDAMAAVAERYAIAVTPAVARLIDPADAADPIARQFLPDAAELVRLPDELDDPIGDAAHGAVKGIVHRYPARVLLKPTHACPVYCRFCFRREQVGPGGESLSPAELQAALDYVRARPEIREVVISGGDPLILSPLPLVDPARIDDAMVAALATPKALFVVLHANHAREFAPDGRDACARLVAAGIPLLGQSVLLRGVNDDVATLEALLRAFLAVRAKPYYLHHLDPAPGTSQIRVPISEGQALMRALRGRVSGLAQPTYVVDIPGGHGKVPVGPSWLDADGLRDPSGGLHAPPR